MALYLALRSASTASVLVLRGFLCVWFFFFFFESIVRRVTTAGPKYFSKSQDIFIICKCIKVVVRGTT